ncbi:MAG: efflux RND transporter permease subunit [Candidatus Obscuribacter sp.]|nr:efflux RND transporter permease subunit [Candidatus Obscuribacter sp.]
MLSSSSWLADRYPDFAPGRVSREISPPKVSYLDLYTGASSQVVGSAVTTPLEQQFNGAQNIKYITSTSSRVAPPPSTSLLIWSVISTWLYPTSKRISAARGRLPGEVKRTGVTVNKSLIRLLLAVGIPHSRTAIPVIVLSNYADIHIRDALKRVKGVRRCASFW